MDLDRTVPSRDFKEKIILAKNQVVKRATILTGIIAGIEADGFINEAELASLKKWINDLEFFIYGNKLFRKLSEHLKAAIEDSFLDETERSDILDICDTIISGSFYSAVFFRLQELEGFLSGIAMDGAINDLEIQRLSEWLDENEDVLKGSFPFDEVFTIVTQILSDGHMDSQEERRLLNVIRALTETFEANRDNDHLMSILSERNLYQIDPDIQIHGRHFVITGVSKSRPRRVIKEAIIDQGGQVKSNISNLTDYLIICADKNEHWGLSGYGRKIEAAIKIRKEGGRICIAHEFDLFDRLFA